MTTRTSNGLRLEGTEEGREEVRSEWAEGGSSRASFANHFHSQTHVADVGNV